MSETADPVVIEVFADACCPFTHVGLKRFVAHREATGRHDVVLRVRAWPLELVNGKPLEAAFIAEEVTEIRAQLGDDVFTGFDVDAFPTSSIPAMALADAAYGVDLATGEAVSLAVRDALFERGLDIGLPAVLDEIAAGFDLPLPDASLPEDLADTHDPGIHAVLADYHEGRDRGVIGSPHFFTPGGDFFCPALDVSRDDRGHLRITADPDGFEAFVASCFSPG